MNHQATMTVGKFHQPLTAVACDELRMWIISGRLAPGSRLVETALAEMLGISRGPVREAIRQLNKEGFVELSPRRGASVAIVSISQAIDCYEVRTALEGVAARLAASHRTQADLDTFDQVLSDGQELISKGRWSMLTELNNDFHQTLARTSRNYELVILMTQYAQRIAWIFSRSAEQRAIPAWREHAEIVEAVRNRDSELAEKLALHHIELSHQNFVRWTKSQKID